MPICSSSAVAAKDLNRSYSFGASKKPWVENILVLFTGNKGYKIKIIVGVYQSVPQSKYHVEVVMCSAIDFQTHPKNRFPMTEAKIEILPSYTS